MRYYMLKYYYEKDIGQEGLWWSYPDGKTSGWDEIKHLASGAWPLKECFDELHGYKGESFTDKSILDSHLIYWE